MPWANKQLPGTGSGRIVVRLSGAHLFRQALGACIASVSAGFAVFFVSSGVSCRRHASGATGISSGQVVMDHGLSAEKAALRARMMALRNTLALPDAGARLARTLLPRLPSHPMRIAAFWPMGAEIDTRPALHALHEAGHHVLLPVTTPRGQALVFRHWRPGCAMAPGRFGTQHPADGAQASPECLLVPLLAFDARGHRLGYGGGYYDRTLADLPGARAVGVGYAAQQVPRVPSGPRDVPLHAMATEEGWITPA